MFTSRATSWLPIAGLLASIGGVLGWLLLGFAAPSGDFCALKDIPGVKIEYLHDADTHSLSEVARVPESAWLLAKPGQNRVFTLKGQPMWVRFTLPNSSGQTIRGVLVNADYFVDKIEGFVRNTVNRELTYALTGESIPMAKRSVWGRDLILPVEIPVGSETQVYLRLEDHYVSSIQMAWWSDHRQFTASQGRGLLAEGIYFGVLLALLGYNAILWLRLRIADIGYYVLYLGSIAAFMALARGLPGLSGWALTSPLLESLTSVAILSSGLFLLQFTRVFLALKQSLPRADLVARIVIGVLGIAATGALAGESLSEIYWMRVSVLLLVITHIAVVAMVLGSWQSGSRQARFFAAAFGCFFAAALPVMFRWFSNDTFGSPPMMYLMVGSALEMMLLSFATADRFTQAQREKAIAQEKLIEETEQRRAIQEAYADELAVEVRERTHDLEEANTNKDRMIAVIGHDLRSPLSSLTQTAELLARTPDDHAALAKFARDSAQVGRQTLLLIEDLVLWTRLRAGSRQIFAKHKVRAVVAPVITLHRAFAGQRGIELAVEVPDTLRISTDLVLAQTLLRNLVANALKFARSRVVVSARLESNGVRITVEDDGAGLPSKVLAALQQESFEIDHSESGLGLRLCLEISRVLKTRLEVVARESLGTEFQFVLPSVSEEMEFSALHD